MPSSAWKKDVRSEEHTSELQSLTNLVCRLLLEKKNKTQKNLKKRTQHPERTASPGRPRQRERRCQRHHEHARNEHQRPADHQHAVFFLMIRPPPRSTLFPRTTLFRSRQRKSGRSVGCDTWLACQSRTQQADLRHARASRLTGPLDRTTDCREHWQRRKRHCS